MKKQLAFFVCLLFCASTITALDDAINQSNQALCYAAKEGNLKEVKSLLSKGANVNAREAAEGLTPLILAIQFAHLPVVKALIREGADVNLKEDLNQATPLMWAVRKGERKPGRFTAPIEEKYEIAELLIASAADINAKNRWNGTALQWAADSKNLRMVKRLIQKGADVHSADDAGLTPLMVAANYEGPEFLEMVRAMIKAGAKVNQQDEMGMTPLMKASMNHFKTDTVRFLISNGADIHAKTKEGYSALMLACKSARTEIVKFLIQAGADLNAKTGDGRSVMKVAKEAGYVDVIEILAKAGAKE